jgi:hypothetical protein
MRDPAAPERNRIPDPGSRSADPGSRIPHPDLDPALSPFSYEQIDDAEGQRDGLNV